MEARLWRVAFLTHVCLVLVLFAAVLVPTLAIADTSVTRVVTLTTPPAVRSRCSVTVNDDQTLTVKCNFENIDSVPKKFVVCLMLDLTKDLREEVAAPKGKAFDLSQDPLPTKDKPTGQLRCTATGDTLSGGSSYHFGCRLVNLAPGLRQEISISSATKYRAPKGLKKLRADQFQVKYLDVIDILRKQELEAKILGVKQVTVTFDADGKCAAVNGQANMVTPMTQIAGGDEIGAIWQYDEEPFKDPFIYYQPLAGISPVACDVNRDGFIDLSDV